jgi:hypothetical protein
MRIEMHDILGLRSRCMTSEVYDIGSLPCTDGWRARGRRNVEDDVREQFGSSDSNLLHARGPSQGRISLEALNICGTAPPDFPQF